jgi:ankyrin repeat protein
MASFHGFVDVVTILITGGALVTAEDSMGMTPLSLAVNSGNEAVVEVLLSHGADPNQRMWAMAWSFLWWPFVIWAHDDVLAERWYQRLNP